MPILRFRLWQDGTSRDADVAVDQLVIAGWTGRDRAVVDHHIEELKAIGVPPPSAVPLFYRVDAALATQADSIQVLGGDSSGEVEPVLFTHAGEMWLSVGSDHTDRRVEAYSVAVSKQMCAKPIAREAWRLAEVAGRWDTLVIRSVIEEAGRRVVYQEGPLAKMRTPADLVPRYTGGAANLPPGTLMTCGTVGAIGGVRPAPAMTLELEDPASGRVLRHGYRTVALPIVA